MSLPPKVSICIPSYNHAPYLPAAIESALNQTYQDFEIVLTDDGSTDGSLEIAKEYESKYPSIVRVFTHPGGHNCGIAATANLNFQMSRGEFWAGLCSDDIWLPDKLRLQVEILDNEPDVALVYGIAELIDENGAALNETLGEDITTGGDPLAALIRANVIPAPTVMARRSVLATVLPEDETLVYSDWDLFIRIVANHNVRFIDQPLTRYRVHGRNTSIGSNKETELKRRRQLLLALKRKSRRATSGLGNPACVRLIHSELADVNSTYARTCLDRYHEAARRGQLRQAARSLRESFKLAPGEVLRPRRLLAAIKNGFVGAFTGSHSEANNKASR